MLAMPHHELFYMKFVGMHVASRSRYHDDLEQDLALLARSDAKYHVHLMS